MSDDLISRRTIKSFIEAIRDCWAISPYVSANDMKLYLKVFNVVLNEISNCSTAFDKERVIQELKGEIELCVTHPLYPGRYIKKNRAIEIVENGGIE